MLMPLTITQLLQNPPSCQQRDPFALFVATLVTTLAFDADHAIVRFAAMKHIQKRDVSSFQCSH